MDNINNNTPAPKSAFSKDNKHDSIDAKKSSCKCEGFGQLAAQLASPQYTTVRVVLNNELPFNEQMKKLLSAISPLPVYTFTSEAVGLGHPDKLADFVSDSILDAALNKDATSRVACEVLLADNLCVIAGEITTNAKLDYTKIARRAIIEAGYDGNNGTFNGNTCDIVLRISEQSKEISDGVNTNALSVLSSFKTRSASEQLPSVKIIESETFDDLGAGDQGIVFGYATNESKEYLPMTFVLAQRLVKHLALVRKDKTIGYLLPDCKSQVTIRYENNQPVEVTKILISTQHLGQKDNELPKNIQDDLLEHVIKPALGKWYHDDIDLLINPAGPWSIGGPTADTGLTGRKIIVDTYGGAGRHGGGAFSGKDATKVDRSGAYMARYVAKHIVAAGYATKCEVQIAYAIGKAKPFSVYINTFNTETLSVKDLEAAVHKTFDLRPAAIIQKFDLTRPIFKQVSCYGHFGRTDLDLPWEKLDLLDELTYCLDRL